MRLVQFTKLEFVYGDSEGCFFEESDLYVNPEQISALGVEARSWRSNSTNGHCLTCIFTSDQKRYVKETLSEVLKALGAEGDQGS